MIKEAYVKMKPPPTWVSERLFENKPQSKHSGHAGKHLIGLRSCLLQQLALPEGEENVYCGKINISSSKSQEALTIKF